MSRAEGLVWSVLALSSILLSAALKSPWTLAGFCFLTVAACLRASLMILRRTPEPLSWDRMNQAGFFVVALVGLLVPASLGLVFSAQRLLNFLMNTPRSRPWILLLLTATVFWGLVWVAHRRPSHRGDRLFLAVTAAVSTVFKLIYVAGLEMTAVSDFAAMWRMTSRVLDGGFADVLESATPMEALVLERSLPYFLPLRLVGGPGRSSYTVPNVFAGLLMSFLIYHLTRSWFGKTAARVAFVLSLAAVETTLACGIPTHDIPGTLYTIVAFVLWTEILRRGSGGRTLPLFLLSAFFGLTVFIVELQRSTGVFLFVSCSLPSLIFEVSRRVRNREGFRISTSDFAKPFAWLVLVPVLVYQGATWGFSTVERIETDLSTTRGMVLATGSESWGWARFRGLQERYSWPYGDDRVDWQRFAVRKLASETYYSPLSRLTHYLRKTNRLYNLGSQMGFYVRNATLWFGGRITRERERQIAFVSNLYTFFFLCCFISGAIRLWMDEHTHWVVYLPMFYLAIVSGLLILFAILQPRYLYPIWYLGAIYAGYLFARQDEFRGRSPLR